MEGRYGRGVWKGVGRESRKVGTTTVIHKLVSLPPTWWVVTCSHILPRVPSHSPTCPVTFCHMSHHILSHVPSHSVTCPITFCHMSHHILSHVPSHSATCPITFCHMSRHILPRVPSHSPTRPVTFSHMSWHILLCDPSHALTWTCHVFIVHILWTIYHVTCE